MSAGAVAQQAQQLLRERAVVATAAATQLWAEHPREVAGGAAVVLVDRDEETLTATTGRIEASGGVCLAVVADISVRPPAPLRRTKELSVRPSGMSPTERTIMRTTRSTP